jgi:hypothetical protein
MITTEYTSETDFIKLINAEFVRLGVDTDTDPYSGVMVEDVQGSEAVVRVFDDYTDDHFYADQLLVILKDADFATLDPDDDSNIWEVIRPTTV